MAQDRPSSPAVAADSARFASAAAVGAAPAAPGEEGDIASLGAPTAPAADSCCGRFGTAGRRRWKISLALGPAAGTRSSASRWRMRSVLICGLMWQKGRRRGFRKWMRRVLEWLFRVGVDGGRGAGHVLEWWIRAGVGSRA